MQTLLASLHQFPELALFLTLAVGFWFGSLKIGSFSLGAVTSTLIAGVRSGWEHRLVNCQRIELTFGAIS